MPLRPRLCTALPEPHRSCWQHLVQRFEHEVDLAVRIREVRRKAQHAIGRAAHDVARAEQAGKAARVLYPCRWQYAQDAGFVHYWYRQDYKSAAEWYDRASRIEGAPWWLRSMAASTLAEGGDRQSSRQLWQQLYETTDDTWVKNNAQLKLGQLTALDEIDAARQSQP